MLVDEEELQIHRINFNTRYISSSLLIYKYTSSIVILKIPLNKIMLNFIRMKLLFKVLKPVFKMPKLESTNLFARTWMDFAQKRA